MTDEEIERRLRSKGFGPLLGTDRRWWRAKPETLIQVEDDATFVRWDGQGWTPYDLGDDPNQEAMF